ncbi:MAG: hypothetical protein U9R19_08030 [Bacteroidota bacterium]|nr:hypothetical protein [Bacteroidota bacterium]
MDKEQKNPHRKIIIAILIPVIAFIVVCTIASGLSYRNNPFDLQTSWYLWIVYVLFTAYWEDLIFFRIKKQRN